MYNVKKLLTASLLCAAISTPAFAMESAPLCPSAAQVKTANLNRSTLTGDRNGSIWIAYTAEPYHFGDHAWIVAVAGDASGYTHLSLPREGQKYLPQAKAPYQTRAKLISSGVWACVYPINNRVEAMAFTPVSLTNGAKSLTFTISVDKMAALARLQG